MLRLEMVSTSLDFYLHNLILADNAFGLENFKIVYWRHYFDGTSDNLYIQFQNCM